MEDTQTQYAQALQKGRRLNEAGRWQEALAAFRLALQKSKTRPEVYEGLGDACVGLKQFNRALDCYKLAARFNRGQVEDLLRVADIQERLGQLHEAGRTYLAAGETQLRQRDLQGAIGHWQRAVRLEPNLLGAHQRLAMAFKQQQENREAVREYLAIARILDMRGEKRKALQICQAAHRLDPHNADIVTAVKLIKQGEKAYPDLVADEDDLPLPVPADEREIDDGIFSAVRQMASVLEAERSTWQIDPGRQNRGADPIEQGRLEAEADLTAEIFREEEDEDYSPNGLLKLERDALIGQAIDFESRQEYDQAVLCYERAIAGGLRLPAAFFALGYLYTKQNQLKRARAALKKAARDPKYVDGVRALLSRLPA